MGKSGPSESEKGRHYAKLYEKGKEGRVEMKSRARKTKIKLKGKGKDEKNGMEKLGEKKNLKETTRRNLSALRSSSVA
jgi:hypothetical protein